MKIYSLIFFISLSTVCRAASNCDTIEFCHVYYNDTVIYKFNQFSNNAVVQINKNKILAKDSLKVFYFRDTPCFNCEVVLLVEDQNGRIMTLKHGDLTDAGELISVSLNDLKRQSEEWGVQILTFYRMEEGFPKLFLFTLIWK